MCERHSSNRAAAVFNKHLKWLHMAGPIFCGTGVRWSRAWGGLTFTDDVGCDEKMVTCVVLSLTHLHFKLKLKNCWDGEMWSSIISSISQWTPWFLMGFLNRDVGFCPAQPTAKWQKERERGGVRTRDFLSNKSPFAECSQQPCFTDPWRSMCNIRSFTSFSLRGNETV